VKKVLARYTRSQVEKAKKVRALFFDVDGVLTDGKIIYDDQGHEWKMFDVKDGLIVSYLKKEGLIVGAITGRESVAVARRMEELRVDFCHQGVTDKADVCRKLMKHYGLRVREVAYMGDDLNDLPVFGEVGFSICPSDAPVYVRHAADLVTFAAGGQGAFREAADLILAAQGRLEKLIP
jgi:3-deoxy-D-manno-octulosonate 8-phosphate phosphatase (KDO 8-P phosphatase)